MLEHRVIEGAVVTESGVPAASAAEVFERMQRQFLEGGLTGDLLAEDAVIETPFAPPGRPRRIEGRAEFLAFAEASMARLPLRIEECRNVVIHHTADPDVIVVEYELVASMTDTGRRSAAPFIGVLTARGGRIAQWREYQNVLAMAEAMGQLPALISELGGRPPGAARSAARQPTPGK
jgi:uncharacterized protein